MTMNTDPTPEIPAGSVSTEAVQPVVQSTLPRGSRARWLVAGLVTALVVAGSAAAFVVLTGGSSTSSLAGSVPAGSVGYLEIRLDAPGDQRQNAANFLSHFPGFADQSTLGTKLDEALDQLVGRATSGTQTFTGKIKSWLGDSVAIVLPKVPSMNSGSTAPANQAALMLVSVKDAAGARTWAQSAFPAATAADPYAGNALSSVDTNGSTMVFGVVGNVLLAGDPASVHAAIDANGAGTFRQSDSFKAAAAAVSGDHVAFGFLDLQAIADAAKAALPASTASPITMEPPAWAAISVRAEAAGLSATVTLPRAGTVTTVLTGANRASTLAARLPAGTIVAGDVHDLGTIISAIVTGLAGSSGATGATGASGAGAQLQQALDSLGGIQSLVGWIGDADVVVARTDSSGGVAGGLVIGATDKAAAASRLLQLKQVISLFGQTAGLTSTDETYNGTVITLINAGSALQSIGGAGPASPAGGVAGAAAGLAGNLQIGLAQKGDLVIAGIGDAFIKAVLDVAPGATLADQAGYQAAMNQAGLVNAGQLYVDLASAIDLGARALPPDQAARYASDIKPYLAPFSALAVSGSTGDLIRIRVVIAVK